jgi:hypothetical protein
MTGSRYRKAARRLDKEYKRCESAEEYLQAIMRIWTECRFIKGEWSCSLEKG